MFARKWWWFIVRVFVLESNNYSELSRSHIAINNTPKWGNPEGKVILSLQLTARKTDLSSAAPAAQTWRETPRYTRPMSPVPLNSQKHAKINKYSSIFHNSLNAVKHFCSIKYNELNKIQTILILTLASELQSTHCVQTTIPNALQLAVKWSFAIATITGLLIH